MKILLGPLQKLGNLFEENAIATKEMHVALSLDLKEASKSNNDLLKEQTSILLDIKSLIKNSIKGNSKKEKGGTFDMPPMLTGGIATGIMIASMAVAILASAGILSFMPVLAPAQILTALAVGGLFALLAPTFVQITQALNGGGVMQNLAGKLSGNVGGKPESMASAATGVGLAMVSMAIAIAAVSWIMMTVVPLNPIKALTALLIGIAFIPLSTMFGNLVAGLNKYKIGGKEGIKSIALAGLAMVTIAVAISLVAHTFNILMPSSFNEPPPLAWTFKTGLVVLLFTYSFTQIAKAVKGLDVAKLPMTIGAFAAIAASIVGIALIFTLLAKVGAYVAPPLEWTLKAGLTILIFSATFKLIASSVAELSYGDFGKVAIAYTAIAGSILATAFIFSYLKKVDAFQAPPLAWTFKAGLAVLLFASSFYLVAQGIKGLAYKDMGKVVLAYGLIAGSILATAYIFNYLHLVEAYNAPPLEWTVKAGLAILLFAGAFVLIANTAGKVGFMAMVKAGIAIPIIALTILATSYIFGLMGGVENWIAPPLEWTLKAGMAIAVFGVAFVAVALMATALTPVALLLGAAGVILIAGTMWVVSWIFSKIPEGAAAGAATLSKVIFAPMNEMVNVFKRFKDEIGIENLIPLGKGLIAVSAGYLSLAGAMTGTAIGGVISGIVGAGKKVLDFVTFGLTKSDTPFDLLDKLSERLPQIIALSKPVYDLGTGMKRISQYSEGGVAGIGAIIKLGKGSVSKNLGNVRNSMRGISTSFASISDSSNNMNIASIDATTKMFDAIAKVADADGEDAMSVLARELMKAVNELSEVVDKMDESVKKQPEGLAGAMNGALSGFLDKIKGKTNEVKNSGESGGLVDVQPIVDAIQELEERFSMPLRVVDIS